MNHSPETIDELLREGANLKKKLGILRNHLAEKEHEPQESKPELAPRPKLIPDFTDNSIHFISTFPGGLKKAVTDIFSLICNFEGVDYGGIYIFNKKLKRFDMVCHYNLLNEYLARVITFDHDSWQVKTVLEGFAGFCDVKRIPVYAKISCEKIGIREIAIIPLIHAGEVVGCMNLASGKDDFLTDFEKLVIEGLALRISRTVALQLAQLRLCEANEELTGLIVNLRSRFQDQVQLPETASLTGFIAEMRDEIDGLYRSMSQVILKIMQKLESGQRNRDLPFRQKKVDEMLHDIDLIVRLIARLKVCYLSQAATINQVASQLQNPVDGSFIDSIVGFYKALEALVMDDKEQRPAITVYIAGQFKSLAWPVRLRDVKIRINRLTLN